ncbi:hypothetical protein [uncultured Streptococcus sp.]|uniref:hypothetical protein n=1 Tax=uncultured Streptococcus sp. TaxID=83427 RepID=UPI0025899BDB|nr:hypothetical protein [uncultured Streptococcus sp.]
MNKHFLAYKGKVFTNYDKENDGNYYLISDSEESLKEGYKAIKEEFIVHQNYNTGEIEKGYLVTYKKLIPKDKIEKIYRVSDSVLYKGKTFGIVGSSDDNFDQPNSWVRILTDDINFLKENNLWTDASEFDNEYGHIWYASSVIPVSEVTILRTREDLPID